MYEEPASIHPERRTRPGSPSWTPCHSIWLEHAGFSRETPVRRRPRKLGGRIGSPGTGRCPVRAACGIRRAFQRPRPSQYPQFMADAQHATHDRLSDNRLSPDPHHRLRGQPAERNCGLHGRRSGAGDCPVTMKSGFNSPRLPHNTLLAALPSRFRAAHIFSLRRHLLLGVVKLTDSSARAFCRTPFEGGLSADSCHAFHRSRRHSAPVYRHAARWQHV